MIYGERVRQLREMHKLTQAELAAEIPDLTQSRLSRIESELALLEPDLATTFSAIFGVTAEYFSREPDSDFAVLTPQFRSRSKLTKLAKNSALQWARLIHEEYLRLLSSAKSPPAVLKPLYGASPHDAASEVRRLLKFSSTEPLPYLLLAAERIGIRVLGVPVTADGLDAFCLWQDGIPVICVLDGVPGDRLRHSVAHELGHLVLHPSTRGDNAMFEREADEFAAELLTPRAVMRDIMPRNVTLKTLTMTKTTWGVSVKSLVRTARELGIIEQSRAISLYKQISARGWNRDEPGYVPLEKPRAFRKMAELLYGEGPNLEAMAQDAGWSEGLLIAVLSRHAKADELPFEGGPRYARGNVVYLQSRMA